MGTMPTMRAVLLCLLLLGAHEYPVLDRRPGSNDLELDLRWICPVLCPSLYVVIDYFSHSCLKMCKICLKRTLDATFFFRLFGVDVLWRHRWITFGNGLVSTCRVGQHFSWHQNWRINRIYHHTVEGTMRIKNDLEFQIGKYQSRATCFDIILTEARAEVWMSKHVARDWYFPIWNERSFLISFSLNIDNQMHFDSIFISFWRLTHLYAIYLHGIKIVPIKPFLLTTIYRSNTETNNQYYKTNINALLDYVSYIQIM